MQQNESLCSRPEQCNGMQYSQEQAGWLRDRRIDEASTKDICVNLGNVDDKAARWWGAILADGEGFQATVVRDGHTYQSSWSIRLLTSKCFQLRRLDGHNPPPPTSYSPPSYEAALGYLSDFCLLHNIHSQSSAALAACLHFPFLRDTAVILPLPKPYPGMPSPLYTKCDIVFEEAKLLDYYMTISCNIWGMQALLCGDFFDLDICCNAVSPWSEPALEIITSILRESQYEKLAATMGKGQPNLAALWLGSILTGGEKRIFRDVRLGLSAVELHAAAWTGTIHSFIGPWSPASISIKYSAICRSDEAQLLFLTECEGFSRVPVCPWQPFGTTPLEHTEIEVRQHAQCNRHCLQYVGWRWDSIDKVILEDKGCDVNADGNEAGRMTDFIPSPAKRELILRSEILSEVATRSIFGWQRTKGFPAEEKAIRMHEWLDLDKTDEEEEEEDDDDDLSTTDNTSRVYSCGI